MKTVSILIPNRHAFDMLELCILSIRRFTQYPHKIIVFDDFSYLPSVKGQPRQAAPDITYLRECQKKGWLMLIENPGPRPLTHGGSINRLLEVCDTDYAIIMDNDVQIKGSGWLRELVQMAGSDPKILAIVDFKAGGFARRCYRSPILLWWLGLLNMHTYRDGMEVDWKLSKEDRRKWPYTEEFADYYPLENCKWTDYFKTVPYIQRNEFDVNRVCNDPGSQLYIKWKYENPRGYRIVPLPPGVRVKYHHFAHISMVSVPSPLHEPAVARAREERFAKIREELRKLKNEMGIS